MSSVMVLFINVKFKILKSTYIKLTMLYKYACKKLFVVSDDCYIIALQALYLHSRPNNVWIYSLNFQKEVLLFISVGS